MESNIIILNSCQEFTKQCLNTGSAFTFSLSIWNGISFKFSNPHPNQDQVYRNANWTNSISTQRKKTPSQHRRDRRRWEQKYSPTPASGHLSPEADKQPPVSGLQSPVTGLQPPVTGQQLPVIGIQPPVTVHPLPVTGHHSPVTGKLPPVTGHLSPVADDSHPATGLQPQVIGLQSSVLHESSRPTLAWLDIHHKNTPMETDKPVMDSPSPVSNVTTPSPKKPSLRNTVHNKISKQLKPCVKLVDLDQKDLWPQPLLTNGKSNEFIEVNVLMYGDQKASLSSLRRSLKKCNLRSTNPKEGKIWFEVLKGIFDFKINIPRKNLYNIVSNLHRNWTPVDDSMLYGFHVETPGDKVSFMIHIRD